MLVLTRKVGERIELHEGDEIDHPLGTIVIKEIRRNQVRIGLDFPEDDVAIHREEVADEIRAEEDGGGDPDHDGDGSSDGRDVCTSCGEPSLEMIGDKCSRCFVEDHAV